MRRAGGAATRVCGAAISLRVTPALITVFGNFLAAPAVATTVPLRRQIAARLMKRAF